MAIETTCDQCGNQFDEASPDTVSYNMTNIAGRVSIIQAYCSRRCRAAHLRRWIEHLEKMEADLLKRGLTSEEPLIPPRLSVVQGGKKD